ncbi:alpha/beta fold hydrolase [Tumebacillus lipolyticus]|uniref:Alpha/beta fold hydrolase n=1 Tax=Tumebacillus lipolyticus TaxID=1280370 RepID=A0ABW4ZTJ7_9BACL
MKSGKGGLELLAGEEGRAFLQVIFHKRDLFKLAKLWAFGVEIEWQGLDSEHRYKRITLPTYPFLGERHWVPQSGRSFRKTSALHPLVDQINAKRSLQGGLVLQKAFHPTDRIVDEHRVMGQPMLPGVGYLEMAFAASRQIEDATNHRLTDVVWLQPIVVAEPKEVEIVLHQQGEDLSFEIVSHEAEAVVLHARGELKRTSDPAELTAQSLDIPALKSRMRKVDEYDSQHIYSLFDAGGVSYGPYFQGLGELWIGEEEVLATLHMASGTERELDSYTMHPSLMDSALHAMIGLQLGSRKRSSQPTLPFAVGEVEIVQPLKPVGFAYVLAAGENRFHVALLDEAGQVCIKLRDVALRERREEADDFYYGTTWVQEKLSPERIDRSAQAQRSVLFVHSAKSFGLEKELVKLCADADIYRMRLGQRNRRVSASTFEVKATEAQGFERFLAEIPALDEVYFLGGLESDKVELGDLEALANSQELGVLSLFRLVKALSKQGLLRQNLKLKVVTNDVLPVLAGQTTTPYAASLHGFTLTMAKEYAEASITCLDISLPAAPTEDELRGVTLAMVNEPGSLSGEVVAIRNGKRFVRTIHPISLPAVTDTPFKTKGVYLIVGGAGGIGLEMAKHLANTVQGRIVLIGRSELEEARIAKLGEIEALGGEVLYLQADATDPNSMRAAVASAKERFGSIDGVIHSAIVLRDRAIENMEEATLLEALTPKVQGSVVLQHVLQDEPLDFMLFLSSANSFVAGPGQSNYSAGCTFKDAFALHLDQVMPYPVKVINWGYWGSVGIVASEEYNKRMAEFGVHSIKPEEGMRAIETALANPISQLIPYKAERRVLEQMGVDYSKKIAVYPEREPSLLQIVATATPTGFADIDQLEGKQQDFAAFERFGQLLLLKAFREMGVFQSGGEQHEIEELKRQLGVLSEYDRLFDALLDMLRKGRFAELAGTRLITTTEVDRAETIEMLDDLVGEKERFLASRSDMEAYVNLVWACVTAYPEVLTGRKNHMEVMFPNGSKSLVENIYKGNRMTDYYNQLVASFVQEFVKQRLAQNDRASVRILEIGAGTGGTSSAVLERLRAFGSHVQYDYTDISVGFTQHGRRTFGTDYPFVEFTVLDIEKDPLGQGFEPNRIDLILATNVLHATKRIANTLGQAKKLLKKNGLIVINEATAVQDFATLTFGMTSGWWLYEDAEQRLEHSPLLSAKKWQEVLAEHGFGQAKVFGLSGQQADESGQTVIVGESDGLVWQDRKAIQTERAVQTSVAKQAVQTEQPASTATRGTGKTKEEAVQEFVETIFSEVLRIDRSKLDRQTEFEQYGVDSLVVMELNKQFEKEFGKLPATLLFDHPTLARLSEFFLTEMPDIVAEKFGSADPADVVEQVVLEDLFGAKRERNSDAPREAEARILQLSGVPLREEFTNYWKTIREKGMAPQVIERVQPESLAARPREQLVHFLLDTPSAKNMEVVMTGQGPTILLIPGFGYTAPQWLPQIEEWARDHRIVVIHSPGFGLSEGGEDFSLVGVAQVLIEVLDRLAIGEPVHVVGSSWGGQVGQVLAEQQPQRIASLTLVSSFIQTQQDENIPLKEKVKQDFANIGAVDHYEEIANWEASNAHALHYAQVYADQGPSTSEYLAAIRTPTLIVVGQADQVVDPAESKRLHEQIAGSTYCEIEGAGHAPSYTHAETFNRVVGEFIKRHTAEAIVINASG